MALENICIGGTPSASSEYSASYPASNAFDGNASSFWCSKATGLPQWIQYDLGEGLAKRVVEYTLTARSPSYNPANSFVFAGSNNGTDWTTIDTQTGLSWSGGEKKRFNDFTNSTLYRYHRITVTASGSAAEFAEIELLAEATAPYKQYLSSMRDRSLKGISLARGNGATFLTYRKRDRLRMMSIPSVVEWVSPQMSANNAPSPYVVSASHQYGTQYEWKAFDGKAGTDWSTGPLNPAGEWIKLHSGTKHIRITYMNLKNRPPFGFKDFKVQGSNDDTNWTDIYVGSAAKSTDVQEFSFAPSINAFFTYHRVLCVTGWDNGLDVYEIGFKGYERL
jgi:hypothetical protein